jgi:hypothetical protein
MSLNVTENKFNPIAFWSKPIPEYQCPWILAPSRKYTEIFDQNGYDLTELECLYATANNAITVNHRYKKALKTDWISQSYTPSMAVLNHSFLFERKGYSELAAEQIKQWGQYEHTVFKLLSYRPKWGLDFSMDYVDSNSNCFEILHWEFDSFNFEEIQEVKSIIEPKLLAIDWHDAGKSLLNRKSEWHHLDFFAQSDWKCEYFNLMPERFKMVAWN